MHPQLQDTITQIRTSKPELAAHILLVFIVPIVLLNTGSIPLQFRVPMLVGLVSALFILLIKEKWTFRMLGFKHTTTWKEVLAYTLVTALGVIAISQLGEKIGYEELADWWKRPHFLYLFFVVSLFQEIAYRGYMIPALGKLFSSPVRIIVLNTVLFTFLHSIFPPYFINLPLAFVGGITFSILYMKYPNLLLIVISHSILNFVAVLFGFFTIPGFS